MPTKKRTKNAGLQYVLPLRVHSSSDVYLVLMLRNGAAANAACPCSLSTRCRNRQRCNAAYQLAAIGREMPAVCPESQTHKDTHRNCCSGMCVRSAATIDSSMQLRSTLGSKRATKLLFFNTCLVSAALHCHHRLSTLRWVGRVQHPPRGALGLPTGHRHATRYRNPTAACWGTAATTLQLCQDAPRIRRKTASRGGQRLQQGGGTREDQRHPEVGGPSYFLKDAQHETRVLPVGTSRWYHYSFMASW